LLIACLEEASEALRRSVDTLREGVGNVVVEVELLDFRPESLEGVPYVRSSSS
jgi:hypothetical protein